MAKAYGQIIQESHYKVGDKVEYEAPDGGEYDGEIVKLDEPQTGAYYHVKLENGKVVKAKPDQLEKEDDDDEDDEEEMKEAKMDKVNPKALKKDFDNRKDKDIDNDGDVDSSDEYLHNRRKTIKKSMKKGEDDPKGEKGETATMNPKVESQKEETELDELKKYDKNADFRVLNRLSQKQKSGTLTPAEKQQMANAKARLRNHGVTESFRDKLLSVLEKREDHGNVDNRQPYDDNWSPGAKKMKADLGDQEATVDGNVAAADTAKNIANSVKAAPGRSNDNKSGDKNIIDKPEDVTKKAGMKTESFSDLVKSMASAYQSMTKKD